MRKIAGALILFLTAVSFRAGELSRALMPAEMSSFVTADSTAESAANAPKPRRNSGHPKKVPPDYRKNPLLFFSTAPKDSLVLLPGIGPVIAERIVNARSGKRSFTRWDDLLAVKGIGPKTVERLKKLSQEGGAE